MPEYMLPELPYGYGAHVGQGTAPLRASTASSAPATSRSREHAFGPGALHRAHPL